MVSRITGSIQIDPEDYSVMARYLINTQHQDGSWQRYYSSLPPTEKDGVLVIQKESGKPIIIRLAILLQHSIHIVG